MKHIELLSAKAVKAEHIITAIILLMCSGCFLSYAGPYDNNSDGEQTRSKRINVYSLTQNYWDTQHGDTLGGIAYQLLPNNPAKHAALMQDIVRLNPESFIAGDPDKLLPGKRLWMPGYMKQADSKIDPATTTIESFSWGNIKRSK
jgi:hypothetical protein